MLPDLACNLPWLFRKLLTLLGVLTLFLVVAAYSFDDILTIAELGKYLSPVAFGPCVLGLPDFVRHFCLVHLSKLF